MRGRETEEVRFHKKHRSIKVLKKFGRKHRLIPSDQYLIVSLSVCLSTYDKSLPIKTKQNKVK